MITPAERQSIRAALDAAQASSALEGFAPTPESIAMEKRVLAGELTLGQAAEAMAKAAKEQAAKANSAKQR